VNFLANLFTRGTGVSSMRWAFIWVWLVCVLVPVASWAFVFVNNNGSGDIPSGVVTLVSIVTFVITGGKYLQSKEEHKGVISTPEAK